MSLPFDLVILDLDGTILDLYRAEKISPVVHETITAVQRAGIPVTIGTGRTLDYIRTHFAFLGLTAPAVTTQGAVIGDLVTGRVLAETAIPLAQARRLAQWVDESNHVVVFYFIDEHGVSHLYQNRLGVNQYEIDFHDHVFGAPRTLRSSFATLLNGAHLHPPVKFICDNELSQGPDLAPILREQFGDSLYITRTHPRLVEGTAPGVDKGSGVRRLCELLRIDPQRVLAIGDNDNDIPMLAAVGYGVAMGNGSPGAKAVATWIAPPIEEDGAAVALQRLVLDQL